MPESHNKKVILYPYHNLFENKKYNIIKTSSHRLLPVQERNFIAYDGYIFSLEEALG